MSQIIRKGRDINNVNNTPFFLIFHHKWFLRFQPRLEIELLPKEGTLAWNQFQKGNISLSWFTYYFCFQQQKAENCKKLSEKSAEINAESKKISEPYQ